MASHCHMSYYCIIADEAGSQEFAVQKRISSRTFDIVDANDEKCVKCKINNLFFLLFPFSLFQTNSSHCRIISLTNKSTIFRFCGLHGVNIAINFGVGAPEKI